MQQSVHGTAALLDEARAIGRQIRDEAFRVGRTVDWFGLRSCPDGAALGAMGPDLYEGAAGIAVFFAQLSRCWPGDGFDEMARHTVTSARRFTFRRRHPGGAFSGDASICYALLYVGGVLGDTDLVETGLQLLLRAGRTRQVRHGCDLISGAAGLIAVLTTAYEVTGSRPALDLAHDLGEALVSERIVMERGWAWPNDIKSSRPLTGCAHGTAGIASALARLAVATGNAGFDTAARRAVEYERAAYDPVLGGWPEVRMQGVGQDLAQQTASSWCYGSLGVVLARLSARAEWAPDDRAEIDELLCRIAATPMQGNDCVCHGECGVVETLIAASTGLSDASWLDLARRRLSAALVRRSSRGTWRGGIPRQERISDPGFMLGRSGIGYQLLRAAQPGVPSVLLLAAPVATAAAAPLALWRTSHLGATV